MSALPTPDQWNTRHPKPPPFVDYAPVACPRCKRQMFYPFPREYHTEAEIVRCPAGCVQTAINRDFLTFAEAKP